MILKGQTFRISEQEITDCTYTLLRDGCQGGWMYDAWNYMIKKKGTVPQANYKYVSGQWGFDFLCRPPTNVKRLGPIKSYT